MKIGEIEMELPPCMEHEFKKTLDFELQMLQGESKKMDDGRTWFKFELQDKKLELFEAFMQMLIAKPSDQITININGVRLHQN